MSDIPFMDIFRDELKLQDEIKRRLKKNGSREPLFLIRDIEMALLEELNTEELVSLQLYRLVDEGKIKIVSNRAVLVEESVA